MSVTAKIIVDDVRKALTTLPEESIQTCITSPPYWGLRTYGSVGEIGQEDTPEEYVDTMVEVFKKVKQVLKKDGTVWLNIGDTYVGTGHKGDWKDPKNPEGRNGQVIALNHKVAGLKPKDMIGIPWRVAFALQKDGWYLRSDIIWSKPNQMPSPVTDRPVSSYEHVFLLSKSRKYFYDYKAVEEPTTDGKSTRRQRDVWQINTKPYPEAHFAVYPTELVNPCVKAGSRVGDTVLDVFSGSGTTGVAALNLGRNYVGIESNPTYAELSITRLSKEVNSKYTLIQ
jgi:site-specific DNA-methyltransferase (cytosine-N4-specific)